MARKTKKYRNVSEPDKNGYQVRLMRDGKQYSKYFAHNLFGGKRKSLAAAVAWRETMESDLPRARPYFKKLKSNKSTGIVGVSKAIHYDKRREAKYLRYQVSYQVGKGKAAAKTFQVGRIGEFSPEQEQHALNTAIAFRKEYENCRTEKRNFNPTKYRNWKRETLYS